MVRFIGKMVVVSKSTHRESHSYKTVNTELFYLLNSPIIDWKQHKC